MKRISILILTLIAAIVFVACGGTADNKPANAANAATTANAANTAAKPAAAAPTKDALMTIEKASWEAWKNRDAKAFGDILSDKSVGFSAKDGRQDKAAMIKSFADAKCEVKSYSFSDDQMNMIGADVAALTFKADQDYTCDGKKGPASVWSTSVYVRDGDKWKSLLYVENAVVDPKAPPAKPAVAAPAKKDEAKPAENKPDALTDALMAIENKAWDAWKQRDKAGIEGVMSKDFMYVSGLGRMTKADATKEWGEKKCEGLDFKLTDPMGVSLGSDVAFVTYKADSKGSCDGKPVTPAFWVASFDIKEGDAWKNALYTDVPR